MAQQDLWSVFFFCAVASVRRCFWVPYFLQISTQLFSQSAWVAEWDGVVTLVFLLGATQPRTVLIGMHSCPSSDILVTHTMMTPQMRWFGWAFPHPILQPESQSSGPCEALNCARREEMCGSSLLHVCHSIGTPKPYLACLSPWLSPGSSPGTSAPINKSQSQGRGELKKIVSDHTTL